MIYTDGKPTIVSESIQATVGMRRVFAVDSNGQAEEQVRPAAAMPRTNEMAYGAWRALNGAGNGLRMLGADARTLRFLDALTRAYENEYRSGV